MYLPNLKFVAFPIPEIIGGTQKIGQSQDEDIPPTAFSGQILMGFCLYGTSEYICVGNLTWRVTPLVAD